MLTRWEYLAEVLKPFQPKVAVELGVKEGKLSEHLLKSFPDLTITCVDLWVPRPEPEEKRSGFETYAEWDFKKIRADFDKRMEPFGDRVTVRQMDTRAAAEGVPDESVDFVFIDAEHTFEGVGGDIEAWYPKIKPGGIISGHDYTHQWIGVQRAVAQAFSLLHVVLGDDKVWMVVK